MRKSYTNSAAVSGDTSYDTWGLRGRIVQGEIGLGVGRLAFNVTEFFFCDYGGFSFSGPPSSIYSRQL